MNLKEKLNFFGKEKIPFFFCISYDLKKWEIVPLDGLKSDILYSIDEISTSKQTSQFNSDYISFATYKEQFDKVIDNIKQGNTYLLNLTTKTNIIDQINLHEVYENASAKYKLFYKDKFVSFSPETFIKIQDNTISTYPMKGTIDANIPNAKEKILSDKKELAEHTMVVDLLRNDLNMVSKNVRVDNFRYVEKIDAGDKELLQVSSKIVGDLPINWHETIGDIILPLLPAGSISGTPKKMTVKLINEIESYDRDYFSGIWGVYNGNTLDSSILIRFLEKSDMGYCYKSGGGITLDSNVEDEYNEMKDKVYIP